MNPDDKPASPLWIKLGIAAGILVLLAGGAWFFQSQHREQREQVKERLWSIALLKADQIAQWRAERLTDAAVLAERRSLIESVSRFLDLPSGHQRTEVSRLLQSFKERYYFTDILIVDMENKVRFSLSGATELHREYAPALEEAVARRAPVWTSLHAGEPYPFPHISIAAPVFAQKGDPDPKAALILVCDAEQFLYPLIQSWPTPAKTAETLLVRREGDGVLFLNELRQQADDRPESAGPQSDSGGDAQDAQAYDRRGH
jgi:hypothetical protein